LISNFPCTTCEKFRLLRHTTRLHWFTTFRHLWDVECWYRTKHKIHTDIPGRKSTGIRTSDTNKWSGDCRIDAVREVVERESLYDGPKAKITASKPVDI